MFALMVHGCADWSATPFVDVAVEWGTGGVNEQTMVTLSAEEPQKRIEIHDVSQRSFRYAITYNLANGTPVAGPKEETTEPVISFTRLQR